MSIIVSPILRSPLERFHLSKPIRLEGRHQPSIRFVVLTGLLRPIYHGVNLHPGQLRVPFKQPATNLPASLQKTVILRIHNPSEKGAETRTSRRFYFTELAVPLVYIFISSHVLANVANAAPSQATVEITTPLCLLFLSRSDCPPPGSALLASPECNRFHLDRNVPPYTPMIGSYGPVP